MEETNLTNSDIDRMIRLYENIIIVTDDKKHILSCIYEIIELKNLKKK